MFQQPAKRPISADLKLNLTPLPRIYPNEVNCRALIPNPRHHTLLSQSCRMLPTTALRTRSYPLAQSLTRNAASKNPIVTSITLHRTSQITVPPTNLSSSSTSISRGFVSSAPRALASSGDHHEHESHYDPPGGWLFGVPPGEKYKEEGWERIWVWGFWGSLGVAVVAYAYKPDTS